MNKQHTIEDIKDLLESANQLEVMKEKELKNGAIYWFSGVSSLNLITLIAAGYFFNNNISTIVGLITVFITIGNLIADIPEKYAQYRIQKKFKIPTMLQEIDNIFSEDAIQKIVLNHIIGKYNKYPQHLNIKDIDNLQLLFINKQYNYARKRIAEIFDRIIQVENQQEKIKDYNAKLNIDKIIEVEQEKEHEVQNWKALL